jgi:hypothetical protein
MIPTMDATQIIGLISTVVIVGFLVFGLRRGLREKRDKRPD